MTLILQVRLCLDFMIDPVVWADLNMDWQQREREEARKHKHKHPS